MSGKNKSKNNPDKTKVNPGQAKANSNMLDDDPDSITALRNTMEGISKQIQALQTDLKADLRAFKDDITTQVKREVSELRADIDQKFATVSTDIQQQSERINANQARTEEVEAWSAEANTVFLELLREQRRMIEKLDDLESRSRRNNLRIYGIPEDTEKGVQTIDFVKEWLSTELSIPTDLQIQRAHRALTAKPKPDKAPRSVIVNFLQYSTKELVLSKAWEKKNIKIGDSRIYFDHDYSAGVLQQRKDYAHVKAALKKQGIRFQTPYTKMHIHWAGGKKTYNNAQEAAAELRRRGIEVDITPKEATGHSLLERLRATALSSWQRVEGRSAADASRRARKKLQDFQHNISEGGDAHRGTE